MKQTSDADSISLNGPAKSIHSDDSWQETQAKVSPFLSSSGQPKMSLADLISQHQYTGTSIRNRTNRFWTYIGNNHMAQHPELYTADELAKFATTAKSLPSELASPSSDMTMTQTSPILSMSSLHLASSTSPEPQELEARDKATREMQYQQEIATYWPGEHPAHRQQPEVRPDSQGREPVASACETVFEEEEDNGSAYSGQEVQQAQASPVVQVRRRNTIDSFLSLYKKNGTMN
jgi:hypothetical protein